jgi:hypothetical protein
LLTNRHVLRAWILAAACGSATDSEAVDAVAHPVVDLFHLQLFRVPASPDRRVVPHPGAWFALEIAGARAQTEDWLHANGLSLLEDRDGEGRRSYEVLSHNLAMDWQAVQVHARLGGPQLSAGLRPRRDIPALGITIPTRAYAFEFEGVKDRSLGTALMTRMSWSAPERRLQYGIAVPIAISGTHAIGVLLQLRLTLY